MGFPKIPDGLRPIAKGLGLDGLHRYLSQTLPIWVDDVFHTDNSIQLPSLTDAQALTNSVYFSTTSNKVCYKDSSGIVHVMS